MDEIRMLFLNDDNFIFIFFSIVLLFTGYFQGKIYNDSFVYQTFAEKVLSYDLASVFFYLTIGSIIGSVVFPTVFVVFEPFIGIIRKIPILYSLIVISILFIVFSGIITFLTAYLYYYNILVETTQKLLCAVFSFIKWFIQFIVFYVKIVIKPFSKLYKIAHPN